MTAVGITPAGLILSGALDIRHRLCRLLAGVDEARASADPGTRAVLGTLSDECRTELKRHANAVRGQVIPARTATQSDDPQTWGASSLGEIVNRTVSGFIGLAARHQEVYQQIDVPHVREDLKYLLYRALNLSLVSPRDESLVSLNVSGTLQWETLAFRRSDGWTASVAVPWLEGLAPLRWPLVVHEVAHYFLPFGGEATDRLGALAQASGWSTDAFEEIMADAIAQRHFGAAYSFALAREGYLYSYRKHVTGGLSVEQRLNVMGEPDDLLSALPGQWGLSQRETIAGTDAAAIPDAMVTDMRAAAQQILADVAAEQGWTAHPNRADIVASARQLVAKGEPSPAVTAADAAERIHAAITLREENHSADIGNVVEAAVHVPLTDGEIFEAAWREEVSRGNDDVVQRLATPLTDALIDDEVAAVTSKDIWLARSLQSAAVHRWLLQAMEYARA